VNLLETDMSTPRNNATTYFPSRLHWSSEQLADAVPLRLHQLFAFDASSTGVGDSAANAPVLGVVDLSKFEVEIKVPESFARDLGIGMPAQLTSGSGAPYPGAVSAVSPEVVNGEVVARLRFSDEQPPGLRQNQRLSARIVLDTRRNVLMVERGPFLEQDGGRSAYVMDGDSAVKRPIRTGVSSLGAVEILEGLKPGDRIVVSGSDQFGDAGRVVVH
jgi:HlyD family secretion protein